MAGVADGEAAAGLKERCDDRGGESARARQRGELLVEQADEFRLIEPIYETAHQRAQIGGGGCDGLCRDRQRRPSSKRLMRPVAQLEA